MGDELKYHLVGWGMVYTAIAKDGLGAAKIGTFNQALLGIWLWHFRTEGTLI